MLELSVRVTRVTLGAGASHGILPSAALCLGFCYVHNHLLTQAKTPVFMGEFT
jgi:hypothetical protein